LTDIHELKGLKVSFLEHEERYIEFQNSVQVKLVACGVTQTYLANEITELKNAPPPVIEQKFEMPHIPQIDENEFEDMKYNIRQLKST
jgi:hypothetical protein